jgi:hypothetical protein
MTELENTVRNLEAKVDKLQEKVEIIEQRVNKSNAIEGLSLLPLFLSVVFAGAFLVFLWHRYTKFKALAGKAYERAMLGVVNRNEHPRRGGRAGRQT